ncbi:MAG TPA: zf-TFIIB domain-containing protein [Solirubrobacterales bacterium]
MNEVTRTLECPKCGSEMRSYERNGVVVDQCTGCKGVFLDRGELERLIEAEGSHYEREYSERRKEESGGRPHKKSRKRSFLEGLLEGGD